MLNDAICIGLACINTAREFNLKSNKDKAE